MTNEYSIQLKFHISMAGGQINIHEYYNFEFLKT